MDSSEKIKWRASFFLWSATIGWYCFLLISVGRGIVLLSQIEAIGVGTLGGFLITSSALTVQYWFRRSKPQ